MAVGKTLTICTSGGEAKRLGDSAISASKQEVKLRTPS